LFSHSQNPEQPSNAAAIDIGATLHVAAVGPDRDPEPVRSFGTFRGDLHRLADWFKQCGAEATGCCLDVAHFQSRTRFGSDPLKQLPNSDNSALSSSPKIRRLIPLLQRLLAGDARQHDANLLWPLAVVTNNGPSGL
jgi:hypothetical protein